MAGTALALLLFTAFGSAGSRSPIGSRALPRSEP